MEAGCPHVRSVLKDEEVMEMMVWYGHGVTGWGLAAMSFGMVVFWAVVIGVGILLYRTWNGSSRRDDSSTAASRSPEQLLAERFARGEIDEEEYRRRLAALHDTRAGRDAPPGDE